MDGVRGFVVAGVVGVALAVCVSSGVVSLVRQDDSAAQIHAPIPVATPTLNAGSN